MKRGQTKQYETRKDPQNTRVCFVLWASTAGHRACPQMWLTIPSKRGVITDTLLVGGGLVSWAGPPLCASCPGLCEFLCALVLLFLWCLPSPLAFAVFLFPLPHSSLTLRGGVWWRPSFRTGCFTVSAHCPGACFCIISRLWCWQRKTLIYGYTRMSLGVVCCYIPLGEQWHLVFP